MGNPGNRPVGIYSYFGYAMPFDERLGAIKSAGFEVTSIGLGDEEEFVRIGEKDFMPELVRSKRLSVEYVHAPDAACNNLWSGSGQRRSETEKEYSSYIAFCRKHCIPMLVMHVSKSKGEQPSPPNRHGLEILKQLLKYAEDSNVKIAVENTQKPEYLDYVFSGISSPSLGLCYDSSHDFLYSPHPGLLLKQWGHLLFATHISDNDGLFDRHWLPKEGTIAWDIVKKNFPLASYNGSLTLEIFPKDPNDEPASSFLRKAYDRIRWFEGMLREESNPRV
jgi:sugar phosphate isomerase/epimerase